MTKAMLLRFGYRAILATTGEQALALVERDTDLRIDVALLDVFLEGMSGLDAAREIRRLRPGLPIVLMTGFPDNLPVSTSDLPLLQKPFTSLQLIRKISEARAKPKAASASDLS